MDPEFLHQPHDKLFRTAFSNPETAAAFLRAYLDSELAALTDWSTLKTESGSYVDEQMRAFEVDLLFTAKVHGEDAHFYFLCEHQSTEDHAMALRLLSYMVRIWMAEAKLQAGPPKLTPIIPVVVAQHDRVWKASNQFHALFQLSTERWAEVKGFTPDFAFRLLQLVELPFEGIQGTPDGCLVLRALKAQPVGELLSDAVWDPILLKTASREILETLIRYTHNEDVDKEHFWSRLNSLSRNDLSEQTMTLAEKFREEGREVGREEGRRAVLQNLVRVVCDLLEIRFGVIPEGLCEEVNQIDDASKLQELHREAALCTSLEQFAGKLN